MGANPAVAGAKKVARVTRLLAELGYTDTLDALEHAKEMRSALRVIHTWAGVPGSLDARHVRELTGKVLRSPTTNNGKP